MRGALSILFQLATTLGIFSANMISYVTQKLSPWGWRLALGSAAFPALLMSLGGYFLPETPNSLIQRGLTERGRHVLEKLRGTRNVNAEFQDMIDASLLANSIKHPFRDILQKRHRPQLVMAVLMPMFQILTGVNCILFYAPVLFLTMGFGENSLLYSGVLLGVVLVLSTFVSIGLVDNLGRRPLLLSGGLQMITCQVKRSSTFLLLTLQSSLLMFGTDRSLSDLGNETWRQPRAIKRILHHVGCLLFTLRSRIWMVMGSSWLHYTE